MKRAFSLTMFFILAVLAGNVNGQELSIVDNLTSFWELDELSGVRADSVGDYDLTDNNTVGYQTSGFDPADLAGLELWLAANQITGKSDGDRVTTWVDMSGNGEDATSGTGPIYKTDIVNGYPVLRFSGVANEKMNNSTLSVSQPGTMFFVWYYTAEAKAVFDGNGSSGRWYLIHELNSNDQKIRFFAGAVAFSDAGMINGNQWNIAGITLASSTASFYTPSASFGSGGGLGQSLDGYNIGNDRTGSFSMTGDIAEIIIYSSALDVTDRSQVFDYLCAKYCTPPTADTSRNSAYFQSANSEYLSYTGGIYSNGDFSIAGWAKPITITAATVTSEKTNTLTGYNLDYTDGAYVASVSSDGTVTNTTTITHTTAPITDTWDLLTLSYNTSTDLLSFTVNTTTLTTTHTGGIYTGLDFTMGANGTPDDYCDCLLDRWGVWGRVLSDTDIETLYNDGAGMSYEDLEALMTPDVSNWLLDLPSGGVGQIVMTASAGELFISIALAGLIALGVIRLLTETARGGRVR